MNEHEPLDAASVNDANDPLRGLAEAWRALAPPDPLAALDEPDAATRATLGWMRAAWRDVAPPATLALPWRLRARPHVRRIAPWFAAAAALVFVISQLASLARRATAAPREAPPLAALEPAPVPAPATALTTTISPDRMELRGRNVRVILFTPAGSNAPAAPPVSRNDPSPHRPADDFTKEHFQ